MASCVRNFNGKKCPHKITQVSGEGVEPKVIRVEANESLVAIVVPGDVDQIEYTEKQPEQRIPRFMLNT